MASDNDSILKQLIEAENSHDIEKMLALMADDVVIEDVPFGMIMKGKDGVKQGFTGFFAAAADFKVEPKSWVTNESSFSLEVIFTGTQQETYSVSLRQGRAFPSGAVALENLKMAR